MTTKWMLSFDITDKIFC